MKLSQIRRSFLSFFERKGHTVVPSSSLIPADDPTLLFANAGMNQFKDLFLGNEERSYVRAASSQKCVRAGGKHNDLDQVGFTERHLTFFEMIGNFSFGDYFKREAIILAWEYLTKELGLPEDKLYPTVHTSDDEAFEIWRDVIGVAAERITRRGDADNFWQMGDVGPCGPSTEIFFDRGEVYGPTEEDIGGLNSRYIEVWNLVFMQYNRSADGELTPLSKTGVDTGAGLERVAAVMQGKDNVFDIDALALLRAEIEKLSGKIFARSSKDEQAAFNVLVDHIRSSSLLIADGCMPSNEGRGYVLRKIIRRAALFAQKLGDIHIFPKLLPCLVDDQGEAFPELVKNRTLITRIITSEIERFAESLVQGQKIFQVYLEQNQQAGITQLTGEQAFKLYDTFGYPLELSRLLAQDYGLSVDFDGFEKEMKEQKERSAASRSGGGSVGDELGIPRELRTTFTGYDYTDGRGAITWVGEHEGAVWIVTDETPFYVAAGGQVDDSGFIEIDGTSYEVTGLKKVGGFTKDFSIAHRLDVPDDQREDIVLGKEVSFHVDRVARESTMNNHTATHLLQAALTTVLGSHIKQSGSVVHPDYLRFDFTHYAPLTDEQVKSIELLVNQKIRENIPVSIKRCPLKQAQDEGVIAFFGDKYDPESVRVVGIPGFSHELCGGTHVPATGAIGLFKITAESSVSNGIRRIVALTGSGAAALFDSSYQLVKGLSDHFKVPLEEVGGAVKRLEQVVSDQQRTIGELHAKIQDAQIPYWLDDIERCGKVNFLALSLSGYAVQQLRLIAEKLGKRQEGVFLVSTPQEGGKISFVIHITQAAAEHIDEKGLASALRDLGLKCGGKNSWIQGGGQANLESLKKVLQATLQQ